MMNYTKELSAWQQIKDACHNYLGWHFIIRKINERAQIP